MDMNCKLREVTPHLYIIDDCTAKNDAMWHWKLEFPKKSRYCCVLGQGGAICYTFGMILISLQPSCHDQNPMYH